MGFLAKFRNNKRALQVSLLVTGVLFIGLGVWRQEVKTVLHKAINICLECIGIG